MENKRGNGKATGTNCQIKKVIGIYLDLMRGGRLPREAIAEKYGISTRTVSRYMDYLSEAGIPVYSLIGKNGGYAIPDDCVLRSDSALTKDELQRISSALSETRDSFGDSVSESALQKISVMDPCGSRGFLQSGDTFVIDTSSWSNPDYHSNKINILKQSADGNTSVKMQYIDRHEYATERVFDPYCIVLKDSVWYTYGYCHTRGDFRLFKVARIKNLFRTELEFERKPTADVFQKLRGGFDVEQTDVVIEFSNLIQPQIEEWLGIDAIYEHGCKLRAKARLAGGNSLLSKLLSFGSGVRVISPAALRDDIIAECKMILSRE